MMKDLRNIWEIGGFVADQNGDDVADRVNVCVDLEVDCLPEGLIDFCARLGFETTSLSFNFLQSNNKYDNQMRFIKSDETSIVWVNHDVNVQYETEESLSELLRFLAGQWHRQFGNDHAPVYKLTLQNNQIVSGNNVWSVAQDIKEGQRHYEINSLTDVWNDLGFLHDQEADPENNQAITFVTHTNLSYDVWVELYYGAARIGMESTSLSFPLTGQYSDHPLQFNIVLTDDQKGLIKFDKNTLHFKGDDKALTKAVAYFFREKHWSVGGHFGIWEEPYQVLSLEEKVLFQDTWEAEGEVSELYHYINQLEATSEDSLMINAYISEPVDIRMDIKEFIKSKYPLASVRVRSAFKPGFFWLTEEILPELKSLDNIYSITIRCLKESRPQGLELPIRWIQEIYPVDEIFSQELNLETDLIDFELVENSDVTYEIIVHSEKDETIFQSDINIPVSKVPYVDEGKYSYPTTSYLSVERHGEQLFETTIQTDRERFYTYYLENVLTKLWNKIDFRDDDHGFLKPLFDRIEIEVEMSEEEIKLPVAEERISSLEALHEDLYFNTLDYFIFKGEQTIGKGYTAPGGVYPLIKVKPGSSPQAKVIAYQWVDQEKQKVSTKTLEFSGDNKYPTFVEYTLSDEREVYKKQPSTKSFSINIPHHASEPKKAQVRPWLVDYSYRGNPIYAYEFFNDVNEEYYSAIKLSLHKPTVLIETGHHANEVSSMPSVVEMLDDITTNHPEIIKQMNLVVIPCANPDGADLHQRMIQDNPEWKHHAARYNAVGLEFSDVRFMDSVFGEANVLPKIMNKWAPDIVIDNHGIPSHEWTQPFAGYHISPRWDMSFWIPNAMLYGIARKLDEEDYPKHAKVLRTIIDSIQKKVKPTPIYDLNQYWVRRYEKYGHRFMPDMFPIELAEEFIFYQWPTTVDATSRDVISRFPDWVSADILSEVADETVYGDVLETCKIAHRLFNLGAIEWISKDKQDIHTTYQNNHIKRIRTRPLKL